MAAPTCPVTQSHTHIHCPVADLLAGGNRTVYFTQGQEPYRCSSLIQNNLTHHTVIWIKLNLNTMFFFFFLNTHVPTVEETGTEGTKGGNGMRKNEREMKAVQRWIKADMDGKHGCMDEGAHLEKEKKSDSYHLSVLWVFVRIGRTSDVIPHLARCHGENHTLFTQGGNRQGETVN